VPTVRQAIRDAGGVPFEVRTAAPSDFIFAPGARGAYMLGSRDLVTNDIEVAIEGPMLDGMVCLTSCDKTVPGQLMAAARLDIPTLMLACGYQLSGEYEGAHVDIEDVFIGAMQAQMGKLPMERLVGMSREAVRGPGVCSGMGTANSMHILCEALGMALPGTTPVAANSPAMFEAARQAGQRIVAMVWEDLRPRQILSADAFTNAVRTLLAAGGSINCIKHLQAVAAEAGLAVDVYALVHRLSEQTPVLAAVRPVGAHSIEAFEAAGGAQGLIRQLRPLLATQARTVSGLSLGEQLDAAPAPDEAVIRPLARPWAERPAIVMVQGTLAPQWGIVKAGIVARASRRFVGSALCFDSVDAAMGALQGGQIQAGHVVVMRGAGVTGGPGMGGGASRVVFAIDAAGLGEQVAMVTDGHLSGLVCKGLVVAEVAPEGAVCGPLALVQEGDQILIDLDQHRCDLLVDEAELARRRAQWTPLARPSGRGWLQIYRRNVRPLSEGAVLVQPPSPDQTPP
jgi:dihydroxy-acid dehydratase